MLLSIVSLISHSCKYLTPIILEVWIIIGQNVINVSKYEVELRFVCQYHQESSMGYSKCKVNQSTESTERWHLRFTLTIERQYRYIKEYIWFIY